jgi:tetratricopeptide (TPR) repeat protein
MNAKHIKKGIKLILTIFLFFSFTVSVFLQEKQSDREKQLREEIIIVYQSKGEQGLRDFFKKNKKQITNKFILNFAETGLNERKQKWLKACEIMAEEKKNEKTLVDVYLKKGQYFFRINNFERAVHFYDISIPICEKTNYVVGLGIAYQNKAFISLYIGNSNKALEMFDKALQFFEKSQYNQGQGNVYLGKGQLYFHTGFYEKALEMLENSYKFFKKSGDNFSLGNVLKLKGDMYSYRGENFAALEIYDKALHYFKEEKELFSCGNVYFSKGRIFARTGNYFKAINMYKNAQKFYNKAGSHIAFGNLYNGMGDLYLKRCQYSKADEFYEKALTYYEKAGEPRGQGNVYISKGDIYLLTGVNSKAMEMFKIAYRFFEKAGDIRGLGNVSYRKGDIYNYAGDNLKALLMYEEAINYFKKAKYTIGLNFVYIRKGEVFLGTGNLIKASEFYNKALLFFEKERDPLAMGDIYHRKGLVYFLSEKYTDAIEMYEKALSIFKKAEMPLGIGDSYLVMGITFLKTGMISKAFDMCQKAIFFHDKAKAPIALSNSYRVKGDIHFKRGQYLKAIGMYDKAIKFSNKIRDIKAESLALYEKAKVLAKLGKKEKALAFFEESIFKMEKIRGQTAFSEIKRTFWEMIFDQYEETVLFMLNNRFYDKSFKYAESMKSRVFLDQMAEGLLRLEKGLDTELKEERDRLVGKLSALTKQMQETGNKDEKKRQQLKEEYRREESQFEDLLIKIRLENPLYASVNYPQPVTVRDLQTDVLKRGETLLSYFISPNKAYAFIVSKENFRVKQLKIEEKEIKGYVERYLHSIEENNTKDMNRFGRLLYEKLFKPLEKYLKKSKEIIIVPAGKLETIPFESLIIGKKESGQPVFLLEKYRIKYLQSASLLSILRKHYTRESSSNGFIGFGDPVYDYENFKQGKPEQGSMKILATESTEVTEDEIKEIHRHRYARAGGIMDRLPHSGEEIQAIARLFEKQSLKSISHLREQAAEEKAKAANMKDFDYIHFSCHGLLNDDFQSLVLTQLPPERSKEDGYFMAISP